MQWQFGPAEIIFAHTWVIAYARGSVSTFLGSLISIFKVSQSGTRTDLFAARVSDCHPVEIRHDKLGVELGRRRLPPVIWVAICTLIDLSLRLLQMPPSAHWGDTTPQTVSRHQTESEHIKRAFYVLFVMGTLSWGHFAVCRQQCCALTINRVYFQANLSLVFLQQ